MNLDARTATPPVWLPRLLAIAAVAEGVTGLALLLSPSVVAAALLRSGLDAAGVVIGRLAGAGLLSLGIACWSARSTSSAPASVGVAWAVLVYNVAACATLAGAAAALAGDGLPALGISVLHGGFAAALLMALLRRS